MNLKDMLFAEAMGLGGGGGALEPVTYTATGWNELPAIDIYEYFPASDASLIYGIALGKLEFSFNGTTVSIPIEISQLADTKQIAGGLCNVEGTGAVMSLTYDSVDEEWSVSAAYTNLMGSWMDITSAVQVGASDIELTLFK